MIHIDQIKWMFKGSMNYGNQHHAVFRDDDLLLQREDIANVSAQGKFTKRSYYFIDNDSREFLTMQELVDSYNEKFKFEDENPEHEVKYVRVIVKRSPQNCRIKNESN